MSCDENCPLVLEVEQLKQEQKRLSMEVGQIKTETRQNDRTITKLSSDLSMHMLKTEQQNKSITTLIEQLAENFKEYKQTELDKIEKIENNVEKKFDRIWEKIKKFDESSLKTAIMWTLWVTVGTSAVALFIYVAQEKYKTYTEEEKQQYYEKRIKESQTIKNIKKDTE